MTPSATPENYTTLTDVTTNGGRERAHRATNFKNQQALRSQCGWVSAQFKARWIALENLLQAVELWGKSANLTRWRKGVRLWNRPGSSDGPVDLGPRCQP
jgi:hypothetical protein